MASFSKYDLAKGFAVDRAEAQETARRQLFISAGIVAAFLCFAAASGMHAMVGPGYKGVETIGRESPIPGPIKAQVRYVDRNAAHRIAVASSEN
jgi:hypothetical protein